MSTPKCPRAGDRQPIEVPGIAGASVTVLFSKPAVGKHWALEFMNLKTKEAVRVTALQAESSDPAFFAPNYCTDEFFKDFVNYVREFLQAVAVSVNNVNGFIPDDPAEVMAFFEYIDVVQVTTFVLKALEYLNPALTKFVVVATPAPEGK